MMVTISTETHNLANYFDISRKKESEDELRPI